MNLVNELQVSTEQDDVMTVLRKAKRLASKLGVNDIGHWLKCELEGYPDGEKVPDYRVVSAALVIKTNGPLPMGLGQVVNGIIDYPGGVVSKRDMVHPMNEVVELAKCEDGHPPHMTLGPKADRGLRTVFDPDFVHQVSFLLRLDVVKIRAIPEAVKNKILDWALKLEERGVHGDNMTFNEREKEIAHNTTINIYNSSIEQLNHSGANIK